MITDPIILQRAERDAFITAITDLLRGRTTPGQVLGAVEAARGSRDPALATLARDVKSIIEMNTYSNVFKPDREDWDELRRIIAFLRSELNLKVNRLTEAEYRAQVLANQRFSPTIGMILGLGVFATITWALGIGLALAVWVAGGVLAWLLMVWQVYYRRRRPQLGEAAAPSQWSGPSPTQHQPEQPQYVSPFANAAQWHRFEPLLADVPLPAFRQSPLLDDELPDGLKRPGFRRRRGLIILTLIAIPMGLLMLAIALSAPNKTVVWPKDEVIEPENEV